MIVPIIWLALLVTALIWELYCLIDQRRVGLTRIAIAVGANRLGRLLLVVAWAFVGLHLFARYTLPR